MKVRQSQAKNKMAQRTSSQTVEMKLQCDSWSPALRESQPQRPFILISTLSVKMAFLSNSVTSRDKWGLSVPDIITRKSQDWVSIPWKTWTERVGLCLWNYKCALHQTTKYFSAEKVVSVQYLVGYTTWLPTAGQIYSIHGKYLDRSSDRIALLYVNVMKGAIGSNINNT